MSPMILPWMAPLRCSSLIGRMTCLPKKVKVNLGAIAAICRDESGKFLGASSVVFSGITGPMMLEAPACHEALIFVEDLVLNKVKVASDYLRVIQNLRSDTQLGDNCMIIKEINTKRSSFLACDIGHERRSCNMEAHRLARFATTLSVGRHLWLSSSPTDHLCIPMNILT
ncbi:hypothetical protein VPH35_100572 [Triticum aestivum]|uniref:Uncharacterized protein n=1 Tax=Aegilops tauschii TaxID=37682 RepID=R7W1D3_AEGTA